MGVAAAGLNTLLNSALLNMTTSRAPALTAPSPKISRLPLACGPNKPLRLSTEACTTKLSCAPPVKSTRSMFEMALATPPSELIPLPLSLTVSKPAPPLIEAVRASVITNVSLPAPPSMMSAPPPPAMKLSPLLPVMVLAADVPLAFKWALPDSVKFSTLAPSA